MNVKGKVLRPREMEQAQQKVRQEAQRILDELLNANMAWFAQFYCELLLQVGLSPVSETDQELLNIANTDKLQVRQCRCNQGSHQGYKNSQLVVLPRNCINDSRIEVPTQERVPINLPCLRKTTRFRAPLT